MPKIKIKINQRLRFLLGISLVVAVGLTSLLLALQYNKNSLISKADNSVGYSGGQVSIDKKYYNGSAEVDSLSVNVSSSITVRLKYNNSSTASATAAQITDSIPTGFTLVTGSVKNCYSDLSCITLNDNLFSAGSINVAPLAGYYGYATDNSINQSSLEIGRKKYTKIVQCQDSTGEGDWYSPAGSDGSGGSLGVSNSASAVSLIQMQANESGYCGAVGSTFQNGVFLSRAKRYIHQVKCESATDIPYYGDWKIPLNQNASSVDLGISNSPTALTHSDILYGTPAYCITPGRTFASQVLDTLGKRYIHQIKCVDPTNFGDMYIPGNSDGLGGILGLSNTSTLLTLSQIQATESAFCTGVGQTFESNVQDTLDVNNGYGYIEYRMTAPSYGGIFGTDVSMTGGFSATAISDDAQFTISVGSDLTCPYLMPAGGVRTLTLGDAELRTDQDFTCNYTAKICFTVFQDDNVNGLQDGVESRLGGLVIKLFSQDGLTEIYTSTTATSVQQCFEPLVNDTIYKVEVMSPPTPYSTTGGDFQLVGVTYQSGTRNINFGYGTGSISLSAEQDVTLGNVAISSSVQNVCTVIHDIQVVDTRLNRPGWSVTATVDDFVDQTNSANIIPSGGRVELSPQTVTVVGGNSDGISPGQSKTIADTNDPVQVFSASSNNGNGTYKTNMQLCLAIPAFTKLGEYKTTVNFVV